jgi:hypothetical protein
VLYDQEAVVVLLPDSHGLEDLKLSRTIQINPQLEATWFNKGNALYMQGKL